MAKGRFLGFSVGEALMISAAAGALSTGPESFSDWGNPPASGGTGGTIAIVADRTGLMVAPDSVRMGVDLSASDFGIDGPGVGEFYDRRLHHLFFEWDLGNEGGSWAVPVNVLANWQDPNRAIGPWIAAMYPAGSFTATVTVTNPLNGRTSQDTYSVTVADPDTVYPGARTVCVSPTGSTTGAPSGATVLTASQFLQADLNALDDPANPTRILFERGQTYDLAVDLGDGAAPGTLFGSYGSGARPVLSPLLDGTNSNRCIYMGSSHGGFGTTTQCELRLAGLNFQGNHDPVTQLATDSTTGKAWNAFNSNRNPDLIVDDCRVAGFHLSAFGNSLPDDTAKVNFHFNGTLVTDFGGQYPFIQEPTNHVESSVAITGTAFRQNPNAQDDPGVRAPIRINCVAKIYIAGTEVFHTDSGQPGIKLVERAEMDGILINVHNCSVEGGQFGLSIALNATNGLGSRSPVVNAIIDGVIVAGVPSLNGFFMIQASGVTLRNCLANLSSSAKLASGPAFLGMTHVQDFGTLTAEAASAPIEIYAHTFGSERADADNNGNVPGLIYDFWNVGFTGIDAPANHNIIHQPNLSTPQTDAAPLSTTALFTPQTPGSPADLVKALVPLTGSSALNAAPASPVAVTDIDGTVRDDPAEVGAWEAP